MTIVIGGVSEQHFMRNKLEASGYFVEELSLPESLIPSIETIIQRRIRLLMAIFPKVSSPINLSLFSNLLENNNVYNVTTPRELYTYIIQWDSERSRPLLMNLGKKVAPCGDPENTLNGLVLKVVESIKKRQRSTLEVDNALCLNPRTGILCQLRKRKDVPQSVSS